MLIHERSLGLNQQHHLLDEQEKNKKQKDVIKKKQKKNIKVIICLMHNVHMCKLLTTLFIHPQLLSTYKASDDIPLFCFRTSPSFNKTQRCGGQHDSFESYG